MENLSDAPSQLGDLNARTHTVQTPSNTTPAPKESIANIDTNWTPPSKPEAQQAPKQKVGLNLLQQLKEKQKKTAENSAVAQELNEELMQQLLAQYVHRLEQEGKDLVKTQLSLCDFTLISKDEISCKCNMHLQYNTINSIRQDLVEFFEEKIGNAKIKIRVVLEESLQDAPTGRILSKNEYYEALIQEFPLIKVLKEQLSLNVKAMYQVDVQEVQQKAAEHSQVLKPGSHFESPDTGESLDDELPDSVEED